jgi:hypothetical protein
VNAGVKNAAMPMARDMVNRFFMSPWFLPLRWLFLTAWFSPKRRRSQEK